MASITKNAKFFWLGAAFIFFILDRLIKNFILYKLSSGEVYFFSGDIPIFIKLFENRDIAFGIPFPFGLVIVFSSIIIFILLYILVKNFYKKNYFFNAGLIFIILGAASNLWDRIKLGYVIDYVHIYILPIFNLADILIVTGVLFLLKYAKKN